MADLLKALPVAERLDQKTRGIVAMLEGKSIVPKLAILRIGERAEDLTYEKNILKRFEKTGMQVKRIVLPPDVTTEEAGKEVQRLNEDPEVSGVLMFLPFPKTVDETAVREMLDPAKDVDGCTSASQAGVFTGSNVGFAPCTPQAAMEMLEYYNIGCVGKNVVVVGRSLVVGKPLAMRLLEKNATVTICHSKTKELPEITKKAEILLAAVGKAEMITEEYLGEDQIIVDVGINWNEEKQKLCGDVSAEAAEKKARAYTPVPGGVGGVTTAVLAYHTALAAKKQTAI